MKIDLSFEKQKHLQKQKISIILAIIFFIFTITSIALFIVFSNYKIQTLMSLVGSVSSSILIVTALIFFLNFYKPNKYLVRFYSELESKEEQSYQGEIKLTNKYETLKKGLSFLAVYVDKQEYYLVDSKMKELLKDGEVYQVKVRGNYIVEIINHD